MGASNEPMDLMSCQLWYLIWSEEQWKTVLWSDEAAIPITGTLSSQVCHKPGSDPLDPKYTSKFVRQPAS
ncbi:hypothetical protein E2C01_065026 [Portunus trituberculatus]|uniref:Uncharacterized protein n=1 Tax=Portunus trituberculatus TaxID=210409 RepID=A0A5B7HLW7_PORTR|nr:hypothetical protein [Portunus trituberculatus]